jgi:hypothetical protein
VCEVDRGHDVPIVEWIVMTDRGVDVIGRCIEPIHEDRLELFGERDDVLNSVFLEWLREVLIGCHCELLDHSQER